MTGHFSLRVSRNGQKKGFSVTVAKKVLHRAVDRNLLKRRCREVLRKHLRPPFTHFLVLSAQKGAGELKFLDIETEIVSLLKNAR